MLMTNVQNNTGIIHPLIRDAYLKKSSGKRNHHAQDVLVLETVFGRNEKNNETYDLYLADLLMDLEVLKDQAEMKFGHIDRIDIRSHG